MSLDPLDANAFIDSADDSGDAEITHEPVRFQFSLRTLVLATVFAALVMAGLKSGGIAGMLFATGFGILATIGWSEQRLPHFVRSVFLLAALTILVASLWTGMFFSWLWLLALSFAWCIALKHASQARLSAEWKRMVGFSLFTTLLAFTFRAAAYHHVYELAYAIGTREAIRAYELESHVSYPQGVLLNDQILSLTIQFPYVGARDRLPFLMDAQSKGFSNGYHTASRAHLADPYNSWRSKSLRKWPQQPDSTKGQ